jgi:pyruvate/2-oxoglutarate dehydrogenase complex dihydrolipoamide acyltransferase (E2) component
VSKGQRLAELESDKSIFEFESPCDGTIRAIHVNPGDVKPAGGPFLQIETADESLRHLESKGGPAAQPMPAPAAAAKPAGALIWTPRATKLAQEAGLDPATVTGIEATGPGGRVSGDDVARYLAARKS